MEKETIVQWLNIPDCCVLRLVIRLILTNGRSTLTLTGSSGGIDADIITAVAATASVPETTESRSKVSAARLYDAPHYMVSPGVHMERL